MAAVTKESRIVGYIRRHLFSRDLEVIMTLYRALMTEISLKM